MTFLKMYRFLKDILLLLLFPKPPLVIEIEKIDPNEFYDRVAPSLDKRALFSYRDLLIQTLIWNMKYRKNKVFFKLAGKLLEKRLVLLKKEFPHFTHPLIIPVPLSDKRRRERGYNQTEEILKYLPQDAHLLSFEIRNDVVQKIRHTESQTKLSRKERKTNLRGAFAVKNKKVVLGRNIIIFDDVVTTGTTFLEITLVLKEGGAKEIITLALAH